MLTKTKKQKVISEAKIHDVDTGSPEVQIALLSKRIEALAAHLKKNTKDIHSRRGLLQMVADRQTQMKYLQKKSAKRFNALMKKLDMKKKAYLLRKSDRLVAFSFFENLWTQFWFHFLSIRSVFGDIF